MNEKNFKLIRNVLIIGIGTVFSKMISFIMTPFFSSWLSPSQYGIYDLIATYVSLCVPFVTLQLDQAVYRFSMERKECGNYYYKKVIQFMIPVVIVVAFVVYFLMYFNGFQNGIILGFLMYFISLSFYSVFSEYIRGKNKLIAYSLLSITTGVLLIIFSVILVKKFMLGVAGLLISFALSYGLTFILFQLYFKPFKITQKDNKDIKSLLKYSIPLIPNNISWWITNVSDRTIINIIIGSYYNGIYAICCKIPTMLSIIFGVFNLSFQQIAMEETDIHNQKKYYNELIKKVVKILFLGSIIIVSFTPIIYRLFLKNDYWKGIDCVPVLLCGAVYLSLAQYVGDILLVKKKTLWICGSTICAAICNVIVNIIIIPYAGILGASIATMFSYFLMFVIRLYSNKNFFYSKNLVLYIINYTVIFIVFTILILNYKSNTLINCLLAIISILFFFILNIKEMKKIISRLKRKDR